MTEERFEQVVEETLKNIKRTIIEKGKEYRRNNNPFHNFDTGAKITGQIRERVLDGFLLKHEISISDIIDDIDKGIIPELAVVNEKFDDNLIYNLIKKASIIDRIEKNEEAKKTSKF